MSEVLSGAEFKQELREGKPKIGLFVNSHSPTVVEQLAHSGYDWLLVDSQHGPMSYETLSTMLAGIASGGASWSYRPSVRSASCRHLRNASWVASFTFSLAMAGIRDRSFSSGAPTMLASFIASAGLSSSCFARRSARRSSADKLCSASEVDSMCLPVAGKFFN